MSKATHTPGDRHFTISGNKAEWLEALERSRKERALQDAAPDLLEALERARDAMGAAIDALPNGHARGRCEHEIEIARAAIAKARGEA